jgi:hypothetical protein
MKNFFKITFSPDIKVEVIGDMPMEYLIEIHEYRDDIKEFIMDFNLKTNNWISYPREWYGDYVIEVYQWNDGLIKVFEHKFDDSGKNVLINIDTNQLNESLVWFDSALEYQKLHGCNLYIKTNHREYLESPDIPISFVDKIDKDEYYAIYNVGKYDMEYEWNKRLTETIYNFVLNRNRTYVSFRNPRNWHNLSINDVADDILGLNKF